MSEINETNTAETKETEKKKCCCCACEIVKKIVIIALGTFIGVYGSLSLFAATHKPNFKKFKAPQHYVMPNPHANQMQKGFHPDKPGMFDSQGPKHFEGDFKKIPPDKNFNGDKGEKPFPPRP